jgi:hypothetical protein
MASFTGTIRYSALEGGFFELHTDDGKVYRLAGEAKVGDGDRVRVHGRVANGGFGIHMSGPSIDVDRVEPA